MVSSDVVAFSGIVTYFLCVSFIIGLSPFAEGTNFHDFLISSDTNNGGNVTHGITTATKIGSGILCVGSVAVAAALAFFTEGVGLTAFSAVGITCGTAITTIFAPASVADAISTLVFAVFSFISIFFELLTYQLPIPAIINTLIIAPGAAPMMYMGVKVLRGGG